MGNALDAFQHFQAGIEDGKLKIYSSDYGSEETISVVSNRGADEAGQLGRVQLVLARIHAFLAAAGLFVELARNHVSGLVHITSLPNDYYHFDPVVHRLTGDRTGKVYQLAQKVTVRVLAVNIEDRKIDFELVT